MSVTLQEMKQNLAKEAINYVLEDYIVGVGTGTTTNCFITELASIKSSIKGAVASSVATENLLREHGVPVLDLNGVGAPNVYIDGADLYSNLGQLIKGGGGALTREKVLAAASEKFICMVDHTKGPKLLGKFPLPVEVLPIARSFVARKIIKLNGNPILRENFVTDNGNLILDVHNLEILEPMALEEKINTIPGVVDNGIFANNAPNTILVAREDGSVFEF